MALNPYVGSDALFLAVELLAIGALLIFLGMRLNHVIKIQRSRKVYRVIVIVSWFICLALLPIWYFFIYSLIGLQNAAGVGYLLGPVFPITFLSGIVTFVTITYLSRASGLKTALGSAFVGTAAAPMFFEFPFLLIMVDRGPASVSVMLIFFLPLILVSISTISLLLLSPRAILSNYAFFSLGGMFIVFALWACFGFSYPSDPTSFILNGISKILSFTTAIMLFQKPIKT